MSGIDASRRSRVRLVLRVAAAAGLALAAQAVAAPRKVEMTSDKTAGSERIVTFENSPFPYFGQVPEQNVPFLQIGPDGRQYHDSPRGGRLYLETTYSDRRTLLYTPPHFDPARPGAALVLFFHGNLATLRDVAGRQGVPRQLAASGLDAALVAPQLAVDALDSSPGGFYEPEFLNTYLHEAAVHLAEGRRFSVEAIDQLPVIIVAYSGGYLATAFSLHYAQEGGRIRGVVLLDALFGENEKFESWIERTKVSTFFISGYSASSRPLNEHLQSTLEAAGVPVETALPRRIAPGDVAFIAAPDAVHNDFVTRGWVSDPLADVLRRLR